jgi:hypothetical protein
MRVLGILTLLFLCYAGTIGVLGDSGMQDFIDECNKMIDTMETCAKGWMDLEEEMINSVNSFADRIVYTEKLIEDEADQILVMAGRIVETEQYMMEVIEVCDCNNNTNPTNISSLINASTSYQVLLVPKLSTTDISSKMEQKKNSSIDHCAPMDELVEVMDACLDTFEVYNDDFLEVLSYIDQSIEDMGDRIVDTECMIMNMSYQIGFMADRIVAVEEMMFNSTEICCGGKGNGGLRRKEMKMKATMPLKSPNSMNDDLLPHCQNFTNPRNHAPKRDLKTLLRKTIPQTLYQSWSTNPFRSLQNQYHQYASNQSNNPMPCDTWWNPFCCASEVCADMIAEMISLMANGADTMKVICEEIIDEIDQLADDIIVTEEDILEMGYKIGDMADCIVVFIDDTMSFMVQYCPAYGQEWYERKEFHVMEENEVCTLSTEKHNKKALTTSQTHITDRYEQLQQLHHSTVQTMQPFIQQLQQWKQDTTATVTTKDNPFGEFVAMVDATIEVMNTMMQVISTQSTNLNRLLSSMVTLSTQTLNMMSDVTVMDNNVNVLQEDVSDENTLMNRLTHCHDNEPR